MPPSIALRMNHALPAEHRDRLLRVGREVRFAQGARLFDEGGHADRFWIVRDGTLALDLHVPGRRAPVVETLGVGDLVGWSWLYEPYVWQFGAEAVTPLRAYEFDAVAVRLMCLHDAEFGRVVEHWVGRVLAHRLRAARTRLLDLYGPYASGGA
ncbi:Crp/Fnr family transcriptional regulator [Streptomyces sp. TRM68416]|uniref:Crp/Fnr family transcriptional regulator n=1 Tax=Streptomyces sp. TRM68416 TaxID=2758412 RepID=UPI001661E0B9|nr:cyclic nucleotide-binding domain-containing protein [Streptomyces sp. TRM68416]MBD0842162.1 cyclic nucleotide-binding domain-containing protein [Streptomyces sp. TRM68416]